MKTALFISAIVLCSIIVASIKWDKQNLADVVHSSVLTPTRSWIKNQKEVVGEKAEEFKEDLPEKVEASRKKLAEWVAPSEYSVEKKKTPPLEVKPTEEKTTRKSSLLGGF